VRGMGTTNRELGKPKHKNPRAGGFGKKEPDTPITKGKTVRRGGKPRITGPNLTRGKTHLVIYRNVRGRGIH